MLQLTARTSTSKPLRPVDLKFCVDVEFSESTIAIDFIAGLTNYDELTDEQVRTFLKDCTKQAKEVVMLDMLVKIVQTDLRTKMKTSNSNAQMEDLFSSYYTITRHNGAAVNRKRQQKGCSRPLSLRHPATGPQ